MNTRLTIVVRKDLKLEEVSPGLLAAQVLHIGQQFILKSLIKHKANLDLMTDEQKTNEWKPSLSFKESSWDWFPQPYVSVLAVNTYEELLKIIKDATDQGISTYVWGDVIPSHVFETPMKFTIGCSLGPDDFDRIKLVTGSLQPY